MPKRPESKLKFLKQATLIIGIAGSGVGEIQFYFVCFVPKIPVFQVAVFKDKIV